MVEKQAYEFMLVFNIGKTMLKSESEGGLLLNL